MADKKLLYWHFKQKKNLKPEPDDRVCEFGATSKNFFFCIEINFTSISRIFPLNIYQIVRKTFDMGSL